MADPERPDLDLDPDPVGDPGEPVPVSEIAPELHAPDAGDGATADLEDGRALTGSVRDHDHEGGIPLEDARPASVEGNTPTATAHASAAPGPVRANP
ncbi:hypothetical protein, partial [Rubrivirga sp.]|uniref:hypothetical protein n=1 Tax=Rubrivirga sp. TaxID=1885344 RepID=UPI003C72821D